MDPLSHTLSHPKMVDVPSPASTSVPTDPVADVVLAVIGPVLAFVAAWLVLSVVLTVLATAVRMRRPGLSRLLRSLALPPVRHLVERAVAVSVAASLASSGMSSAPAAASPDAGDDGAAQTMLEEPVVRGAGGGATSPPVAPPTSLAPPHPPAHPPSHTDADVEDRRIGSASPEGGVHVVSPGENMWSVSEQVLERHALASGRPGTVGEPDVARYWARLIDLNRTTLRSGDPDLVFPGERLTLPSV